MEMYRRGGGGGGGGVTGGPIGDQVSVKGLALKWFASASPETKQPSPPSHLLHCLCRLQLLIGEREDVKGSLIVFQLKVFYINLEEVGGIDRGTCQVWKKRNRPINHTKGLAGRECWQSLWCPWLIICLEDLTRTNSGCEHTHQHRYMKILPWSCAF